MRTRTRTRPCGAKRGGAGREGTEAPGRSAFPVRANGDEVPRDHVGLVGRSEDRLKLSLGVHEKQRRAVLDQVVRAVSIPPGVRDSERPGELSELVVRPGHPEDVLAEGGDVGAEVRRGVAFGVHAHEHHPRRLAAEGADRIRARGRRRQGDGADVGAMGIAEEEKRPAVVEVAPGVGSPGMIGEGEVGQRPFLAEESDAAVGLGRVLRPPPAGEKARYGTGVLP